MAIAFDAVAGGDITLDGSDKLSWSHTCSGSDRLLFVGIGNYHFAASDVTDVTYDSTSLTEIWDVSEGAGAYRNYGWYMVAPSTGSNTVEVTFSTTTSDQVANSMSFTGVDQPTPIGTYSSTYQGFGTSVNVDISSATGELVIDNLFLYNDQTGIAAEAAQTEQWTETTQGGGGSTKPGETTCNMQWDWTNNTAAIVAGVALKQAVAAAGIEILRRRMEGC